MVLGFGNNSIFILRYFTLLIRYNKYQKQKNLDYIVNKNEIYIYLYINKKNYTTTSLDFIMEKYLKRLTSYSNYEAKYYYSIFDTS